MAIDEDALNVLLAEGIDLPTALAGATIPEPRAPRPQPGFRAGLMVLWISVAGVIVYFALRLLS
jgi:hypothetical protein